MEFLNAFSHLDWALVLHLTWQHITLVGIAVILADVSVGDENPCLAAIEAAEKGVKVSPKKGLGFLQK